MNAKTNTRITISLLMLVIVMIFGCSKRHGDGDPRIDGIRTICNNGVSYYWGSGGMTAAFNIDGTLIACDE